jgi:DNA-binding PadR family transcriptional regulator
MIWACLGKVLSAETSLEPLPSLAETIVLYVIESNQPVTGYQIRKKFIEITNKGLSFGTLVPMLHRFEKSGLVIRESEDQAELAGGARHWFLTPRGTSQLQSRLALLLKMLRASRNNSYTFSSEQLEERVIVKPR